VLNFRQRPPITDFRGKVAFVTGASSGIGLGIARSLHEAGASVAIGYIEECQLPDALRSFPSEQCRVCTILHDVTDASAWGRAADEIEQTLGPVEILVNNAGVAPASRACNGSIEDWQACLNVNLWGPILGVRTFVPRMLANQTGAHIVTTTSTSGILVGSGAGTYTVSKIAAVGLMEELRHELASTNIGTSILVPGWTATNLGATYGGEPQAQAAEPGNFWARPQDPLLVGKRLLDGILHNDLYIIMQPEFRPGVAARASALLESMVPFDPIPESLQKQSHLRTPIYVQEVIHRRATRRRRIP
jgi:NAD(P)-dependent dehydrogenase (short-subunit alcohol dehydrogenase family)